MTWTKELPVIEGLVIMTRENRYLVTQDGRKILVGRRWKEVTGG